MQKLKGKVGVICDASVLLLALVMIAIFRAGYLSLHKQGFYCDDESISYPESDESLKALSLVFLLVLLPAIVSLIVEVILPDAPERPLQNRLRRAAHVFVAYFGTCVCSTLFVFYVKYSVGELRPNFLAICKPDFSKINCSAGYITEYTCTSGVPHAVLEDAFSSFPSGHAASTYLMSTFLVLYLHKYLNGRPTPLVVFIAHLVLIAVATVTSMRRITEHQHHWWDVVAGALIGITFGTYGFHIFLFKADTGTAIVDTNLSPPKPDNVRNQTYINENEMQKIDN